MRKPAIKMDEKAIIYILWLVGWTLTVILVGCGNSNGPDPDPIISIPTDEMPAWSPEGDRIAYRHFNPDPADSSYPSGLYVLNMQTGRRTLVIKGPAFNPDWSPDGQWLAFNSGDIFVIRSDGTELQQITDVGSAFFPAWSPEGSRIAFDTNFNDTNGAKVIWLINPDGSGLKDISTHGTGEWRDPDWSYDGEQILHLRFLDNTFGEEIFLMDSTGANATRLTDNQTNDRSPAWSPDRKWIAWHTNEGIWLMRSDGRNQHQLVEEGAMPAWGPDSERIVFSRLNAEETKVTLWIINRDGSGLKQITI